MKWRMKVQMRLEEGRTRLYHTIQKRRPQNDWRIPLTLIIGSTMILTALTFGLGFNINRKTGEATLVTPLTADEQWSYDAMDIVWGEFWRYYAMAGYFATMCVFTFSWFEFRKDEVILREANNNNDRRKEDKR